MDPWLIFLDGIFVGVFVGVASIEYRKRMWGQLAVSVFFIVLGILFAIGEMYL